MEAPSNSVQFAEVDPNLVVIRVNGPGTFQNSIGLEKLHRNFVRRENPPRYIMDLAQCNYLDSTFMGVMAQIGNDQRVHTGQSMTVINADTRMMKTLGSLGLTQLMDCQKDTGAVPHNGNGFQETENLPVNDHERVVHMLCAHKRLIDLDTQNEARFKNVIDVLEGELSQHDN